MSNVTMSVGGPWDLAPNYNVGDFFPNGVYPMIPWTNPFDGIKPWAPPPETGLQKYITTYITTGGPLVSNKEESKLQYIKGLIEGARLMVSKVESESGLVETDSLLDKIIEVIES